MHRFRERASLDAFAQKIRSRSNVLISSEFCNKAFVVLCGTDERICWLQFLRHVVRFGRGGLALILAVTSLLAGDEMPLAKILSVVEAVSYITVTK